MRLPAVEPNNAIVIADNHGALVYFARMDDTQSGRPMIAIEKRPERRDVPISRLAPFASGLS